MIQLTFPTEYAYEDPQYGGVLIPVELRTRALVRLPAYVDTGAAACIFRKEYAEALDLILGSGQMKRFSTPSGSVLTAYGHNVNLTTRGHSIDTLVYFADDAQFRRNVLGREGWLDRFRFALVHYERRMHLGPYE